MVNWKKLATGVGRAVGGAVADPATVKWKLKWEPMLQAALREWGQNHMIYDVPEDAGNPQNITPSAGTTGGPLHHKVSLLYIRIDKNSDFKIYIIRRPDEIALNERLKDNPHFDVLTAGLSTEQYRQVSIYRTGYYWTGGQNSPCLLTVDSFQWINEWTYCEENMPGPPENLRTPFVGSGTQPDQPNFWTKND